MSEQRDEMEIRAYEAVKSVVTNLTKRPNKRAIKEQAVKTMLVAHGELSPDEYETAVKALDEQDVLVRGSGWLSPVVDDIWMKEAIEYIVEREDGPQEFVASVNRVR